MKDNAVTEALKKDFPWVKIQKVIYKEKDFAVDYFIIYDQYHNITDEIKKSISDLLDKLVPIKATKSYFYRKSFLLGDLVEKSVVSFSSENFKSLEITDKDVKAIINDSNVNVNINVHSSVYGLVDKLNYLNILKEYLTDNYFATFEIKINQVANPIDASNLLAKRQLSNSASEIIDNHIFQVENLQIIYGKNLIDKARPLDKIKAGMNGVTVAGRIRFFNKATYKKSTEKDGKVEEVEKVRYNFELVYEDTKMSAVIFPTKQLLEKGDIFKDGQEVICLCDVDEYRERLSLKVKEIGFCKIPVKEVGPIEFLQENENYLCIKPEQYIEQSQMNMFEEIKILPKMLDNKTYVVFDLETTGLEYEHCEIIEIGAVKVVNGKITETFSTLVKPKNSIPADATAVNGIDDAMVANAPSIEQVLPDFYKFTRNAILVAHNIGFDSKFLIYYGEKCHYNFDNELVDSLALSRKYLHSVKNHKLKTICDYLGVELINAHRALADTVATAKCFIKLADFAN